MRKLYIGIALMFLLLTSISLAQTTTTQSSCGNGYCDFYETKQNCASDCTSAGASCSQGAIPAAGCTCNRGNANGYITETSGYCCWNSYSSTACATTLQACTDSDGGNSIYVKGTGSGNYRGATIRSYQTINDLCVTSAQLNEAYCESSTGMLSVAGVNCGSAGCSDGVCLQATTTTIASTTTTTAGVTTTTTTAKQLTADLTGVKEKTFPQESMELKLTVKDETGKLVTDASVSGTIKKDGVVKNYLYPSYSYLCDCYKATAWLSESYLGDYTIEMKASKTNYPSVSLTKTFTVEKPTLKITAKPEKEIYYGNDKISFIITATDQNGNKIQPSWTADIRDETGALVQIAYPYASGDEYRYDYYAKVEDVGKTLTFNAKVKWKEQEASASASVTIQKRAISADIALEKTDLKAGDYIRGKIKVIDQSGVELKDAYVEAQLVSPEGTQVQFFTTTYSNGVYEFDQRKIEDWYSSGEYKLKVKVEKYPDKITFEKVLKITRDKITIKIEFDKTSYKPGDRMFLKMLVTSPTGEVLPDAYVNGEVFPLSQETRELPGDYPPYVSSIKQCKQYANPQGPIFYQGQFIQKYFIDEIWLQETCPVGTYVLRLKVGAKGYEEVSIEKEFQVVLQKINIESGARVKSVSNGADIQLYAELTDELGKAADQNVKLSGYLHPLDAQGCVKKTEYYWDYNTKRYNSNQFISLPDCPEGKYVLELSAQSPRYAASNSTQILEVKYEKGYEYREFRPTPIEGDEFCQAVSCGPGCFQKSCSVPTCTKIFDKECISKCKTISSGVGIDVVENCLKTCEKEQCGPQQSSQDEMLQKLEQIRKEISETKEISRETGQQVNTVEKLLRSIITFIARLLGLSATQIEESKPPEKVSAPVEAPVQPEVPFVGGGAIGGHLAE
ncbi:MAG TPA: hypothetical protein VI933_00435 [archaeon]|nr:hypothetical protein [archaeon]